MLQKDIGNKGSYIISGHYGVEVVELDANLTHAIFLYTSSALRIKRLKERERQHFGSRIDEGGDMYHNHAGFIEWAKGYEAGNLEGRNLAQHKKRIALLTCPVLQLD